jgi:hypothetical protein
MRGHDAKDTHAQAALPENIITDNMDWMTEDIVQASLDRWQVEDRFRMSLA